MICVFARTDYTAPIVIGTLIYTDFFLPRKTRNPDSYRERKGQPDGCCFFAPIQTNPNKPDLKNARSQNEITPKAWNITDRGVNPGKTIRLFQFNPNGVAHIIVWSHPFRVRFVGGQHRQGLTPLPMLCRPFGASIIYAFFIHHHPHHNIARFNNVNA